MLSLRSPRVESNVPLEGAPCPHQFPSHRRKNPHLRANEGKEKAFSLSSQGPEDSASFISEAQTRRPAFSTYAPLSCNLGNVMRSLCHIISHREALNGPIRVPAASGAGPSFQRRIAVLVHLGYIPNITGWGLNQKEFISSQFWRLKSKIKERAVVSAKASPLAGGQCPHGCALLRPLRKETPVSPLLTRTHSYRI